MNADQPRNSFFILSSTLGSKHDSHDHGECASDKRHRQPEIIDQTAWCNRFPVFVNRRRAATVEGASGLKVFRGARAVVECCRVLLLCIIEEDVCAA
jgi:hypothetical protein